MKLYIFSITTIIVLVTLMTSCTRDFEEINTNPNGIRYVTPDQLLPSALIGTLSTNMARNRNFNNELMQVTVNPTDAEGAVFRYDFRSNWADYLWNNLYTELTNFKDMYRDSTSNNNSSYKGISLICQAWIYSILTDTYGDIPFTESNKAKAAYGGIPEPKFDRQKDVYQGLFDMLEEANTLLTANAAINAGRDPVYKGNIGLWRKLGNSMYLRLLMRVSGKSEVSTQAIAKIKEIVETNTSKYPIITTDSESAYLLWTGVTPYVNPYVTTREQDFRAPGIASFFIDNLTAWDDPRINTATYGRSGINRFAIAPFQGMFAGIPSGYAPGDNPEKKSYFYSNTSAYSLQTEPKAGIIMNCAEVKFILAEAAAKGWISGSAETHYNDGVSNAIKYWVPNWNVNVVDYLTEADMQWFDTQTLAEKMQKIHLHKYYALFLVDMQQWFEYRRTGYPVLPKGPGLRNGGIMPARMTYPVYVQSTNPTNYSLAVGAQGPDVISTQVWWQKP